MFKRYDDQGNQIKHKSKGLDCQKAIEEGEIVRVEQNHKDEVNINNIVKKHGMDLIQKTAAMQEFTFDDNPNNDFQETMNMIIKARDSFSAIPSDIRKKFDNDPAKYLDFVRNPENKEALYDMGLAKREPKVAPIQVAVVSQPEVIPETPQPETV